MKKMVHNIGISLLVLLTVVSNGGVHFIVHQCHNSGHHQFHFATRHGCCEHNHETQSCCTSCECNSASGDHTSLQNECCTDEVNHFQTDNPEAGRQMALSLIPSLSSGYQPSENGNLTNTDLFQGVAGSLPKISPGHVQAVLCIFRT